MTRLADRKVLVVGGGSRPTAAVDDPPGNGRAIAIAAAREGAFVAVADVNDEAAQLTVGMVPASGRAVSVHIDAAEPTSCRDGVQESFERLGGLDGIVLNVGFGRGKGLQETSLADWDQVFDVNIRSHFLVLKAAFPLMPPGSSVVLISSISGLQPGSLVPAYDSSKAAQFGLARHAALEGASLGIRVNTVALGLIDTPLGRWGTEKRPTRAETPIPLGRQGTPWEGAAAVIFLLSDEASYVTGQVLAVDGGVSTLSGKR